MQARKFCKESDYEKVHRFLTDCYRENKNMTCWLPERFDDLVFRVDTLYRDERGMLASQDYIYIFEEENVIVGVVIPDGDSFNSCIKRGYEHIFGTMLDLAEKELLPLFQPGENGMIDFLVVSHDSLIYQSDELLKRGYVKDKAEDYDNVQKPMETNYQLNLPEGYRQVYGQMLDENRKAKACHYGFHPEDDDGILEGDFREGIKSYHARKQSKFYHDSFESLIMTGDGDICTYSFCYVNKELGTAFIEPVCTRENYRGKGLCRQMLYGIINRLKEMRIESVYINSYDWRKKVYNSAGFRTIDSIGFWHRKNEFKDFDFQRIAEGYKKRPFLHERIIDRFQKDVTSRIFTNGLDLGCGAGLSSKALKAICRHVTGSDISKEMISVAREVCQNAEEYDFIVSKAEELPEFGKKFDIVTAAGVVQWVDSDLFLKKMSNVMDDHSYLLIYDFWISDKMKECSAYTTWWHDIYLKEFPRPFRNESVWTKEDVAPYGFLIKDQIQHEMEYEFDQDSFIEFMMVQSNVNAKIEGGKNTAQNVRKWFEQTTAPIFQGEKRTAIFTGYSWYLECFPNGGYLPIRTSDPV